MDNTQPIGTRPVPASRLVFFFFFLTFPHVLSFFFAELRVCVETNETNKKDGCACKKSPNDNGKRKKKCYLANNFAHFQKFFSKVNIKYNFIEYLSWTVRLIKKKKKNLSISIPPLYFPIFYGFCRKEERTLDRTTYEGISNNYQRPLLLPSRHVFQ